MILVNVTDINSRGLTTEFDALNEEFTDEEEAREAIINALYEKFGDDLTDEQDEAIDDLSDELESNYGEALGYEFEILDEEDADL